MALIEDGIKRREKRIGASTSRISTQRRPDMRVWLLPAGAMLGDANHRRENQYALYARIRAIGKL